MILPDLISVIIPSYNSENTIGKCLSSLYNQTYKGNYEVVLADSSQDKTPDIVRDNFPQVQLIHFETKTDPGTARNEAIKKSEGKYILCIDSDCVAASDWIEKMVTYHIKYDYKAIG